MAETNTPLPAGAKVTITTSAGTVTGQLRESPASQWIAVLEQGQSSPTLIRGQDVIVRSAEPAAPPFALNNALTLREPLPSIPAAARSTARLASNAATESAGGHYVFGRPYPEADWFAFKPAGATENVLGISYHVRTGFTLGHFHRMKVPAWVAMKWTTADLQESTDEEYDRPAFVADSELPLYAQTGKDFDFDTTKLEKGHMARHEDLEAFGVDGVTDGALMSNIVPQRQGKNHKVWGVLEDAHRNIVGGSTGIDTLWIVSGPYFTDANDDGKFQDSELKRIGDDKVAVPSGTYKVIAWKDSNDELHVRSYMIAQNDTDTDLRNYLVSVDEVEAWTGLDFFRDLDDTVEGVIEAHTPSNLWD